MDQFGIALLAIFFHLLIPSKSASILRRTKRDSVKIGDLPKIIPPVMLKNGEKKYPEPGWTHCIKRLSASVSWRTIKKVNLHKLQATQFQCTWYITSEIPNSNIKISFERLDFGEKGGCTQQFLELIDIRAGKSQGRLCGNRRHGNYVSAGQKMRIDIQGSEPLVTRLRENQSPFIISYKVVKEAPGFRKATNSRNPDLKNKVKNTVGSAVDRSSPDRPTNIYGAGNRPVGPGDSSITDGDNSGGTSLTAWQVAIIVFISIAAVSCVAGVLIKRKCIDEKREKEYLEQSEWDFEHGSKDNARTPKVEAIAPLHRKNQSDNGLKRTKAAERKIPRSASKPDGSTVDREKMKPKSPPNDPSKDKVGNSEKSMKSQDKKENVTSTITRNETIAGKAITQSLVDDTPGNRAPRKNRKRKQTSKAKKRKDPNTHKIDENKNTVSNRPSIRKSRKKETDKPKREKSQKKTTPNSEKVAPKTEDDKVETPPNRAVRKKAPKSKPRKKKVHETLEGDRAETERRKRRPITTGSKKSKSTSAGKPSRRNNSKRVDHTKPERKGRSKHAEAKANHKKRHAKDRERNAASSIT